MAAIVSLDAYRQRRRPVGNRGPYDRLATLSRETAAPVCEVCGAPIVSDSTKHPREAALLLAELVAERLCASCLVPF